MKKINREATIELRSLDDAERVVEGLACVFNEETNIGGWFFEQIDRHAFDNCDMSDVVLNFNHDDNFILARTLNGSLEINVDDSGVHQKSSIVGTSQGKDIYQLVKSGLIEKMSFAFTIDENGGDEWRTDAEGNEHRIIRSIDKLYDVSLVVRPAYNSTNAFARSFDNLDEIAKEHLERRSEATMNEEIREATEAVEEVVEAVEEPKEEVIETVEAVEEIVEVEEPVKEEAPVEESEEEEEEKRTMNTNFEVERREEIKYNATPEYRSAWVKAVTGKGDAELNAIKESRGLTTASATLVPTYIADKISHIWEANKMLNEVSLVFSTAKLSFPIEDTATGAVFHAEGSEAPEEQTLTLIDRLFVPMMAKKHISVSDELIESGEEAILDYIAEELAYYILKLVNDAVINGQLVGGKGVEGIMNSALVNSVSGGTLSAVTFYEGLATLVDVDAPVIVMNPTDFYTKVMGLLDTTGRPIFSAIGEEKYINGSRVILQSGVPSNTAIVGDLSAFKLEMEGREPRIMFDPYTFAREDKVSCVGKLLVAGAVVKKNKLAKVTFTA